MGEFALFGVGGCTAVKVPPGTTQSGVVVQGVAQPGTHTVIFSCQCTYVRPRDGAQFTLPAADATTRLVIAPDQPAELIEARGIAFPPQNAFSRETRDLSFAAAGDAVRVEVRAGETLAVVLEYLDPDGGQPNLELDGLPAGAVGLVSGFTWPTTVDDVGTYVITARQVVPRFFVPGPPVNIEVFVGNPYPVLRALEVNQAVQNWRNDVRLIADKHTLVYAYFERGSPSSGPEQVQGVLRVFDELNNELGRLNDSVLEVPPSAQGARGDRSKIHGFVFPRSWAAGTRTLRLEPLPTPTGSFLLCDENDPIRNCETTVSFEQMPTLDVQFVRIDQNRTLPSGEVARARPTLDDVRIAKRQIRDMFPISRMSRIPTRTIVRFAGPEEIDITGLDLIQQLNKMRSDSGCTLGCKQIFLGLAPFELQTPDGRTFPREPFDPNPDAAATVGLAESVLGRVGWADSPDSDNTVAHELGHVLGLDHTPETFSGGVGRGPCGSVSDPEPLTMRWPFLDNVDGDPGQEALMGPLAMPGDRASEDLELWGQQNFFVNTFTDSGVRLDPREFFEVMSYCSPTWISQLTYERVMNAIQLRFGSSPSQRAALPSDDPYILVEGRIDFERGVADISYVEAIPASRAPEEIDEGEFSLGFLDRDGALLGFVSFEVDTVGGFSEADIGHFSIAVPDSPLLHQIVLVHESDETEILASRTRSESAPEVRLLSPNGRESLGSEVEVSWFASDADGDALAFDLQYSADDGANWTGVVVGASGTSATVDLSELPGSDAARFRVRASDGFRIATDASDDSFEVALKEPTVAAVTGASALGIFVDETTVFTADADDVEDETLLSDAIRWSSSLDGELGVGETLVVPPGTLQTGSHRITAEVRDTDGMTATDDFTVVVRGERPTADISLEAAPFAGALRTNKSSEQMLVVRNNGPNLAPSVVVTEIASAGSLLSATSASQGSCSSRGPQWLECDVGDLAVGESATLHLQLQVPQPGRGALRASTLAALPDPQPGNNAIAASYVSRALAGDADADGDIDRADLRLITAARGDAVSGAGDPRDVDGDGEITILDARALVRQCTRPRCIE